MPEDQRKQPVADPEWWQAILTQAWFDNRSEADRTLVALSAAGIALLVTLLTTTEPLTSEIFLLYALGFLAFLGAVATGIAIFKLNAAFLIELRNDPNNAERGTRRKWLKRLDWVLTAAFGLGVLSSVAIGAASAVNRETTPATHIQGVRDGRQDRTDSAGGKAGLWEGEHAQPSGRPFATPDSIDG